MAAPIFDLMGRIRLDGLNNVASQINSIGDKINNVGNKISGFGAKLTLGLTAPIAGFLGKSVMLASDLSEVQNVIDTTFGKTAPVIDKWSKTLLDSFGLNELEAKKFVGSMGAMLKSSGLSTKASQNMSMSLVELTGDMSSFYDLSHDEAWEKIRSGIEGETEPLKALGINMSVANLEAFALSKGINKSWNEMTQAEQTTLRYQFIMKKTADAQGDFARTSDSFANRLRVVKGRIQELQIRLGDLLLPIVNKVLGAILKVVKKFGEFSKGTQKVILVVLGVAAAIGPILIAFGLFITLIGNVVTAVGVIVGVLSSIGLVVPIVIGAITGIVAILGGLLLSSGEVREGIGGFIDKIKKKFMEFKETAGKVIGFITKNFGLIVDVIKDIFSGALDSNTTGAFDVLIAKINETFGNETGQKVMNFIKKIIEFKNKAIEVRDGILAFKDKVVEAFNKVKEVVAPVVEGVIKGLSNVKDIIATSLSGFNFDALVKAFDNIKKAIEPIIPPIMEVLKVLGGTLVVAIGIVVGVINGLVKAFDNIIAAVMNVVAFLAGAVGVIIGLFTGNFKLIDESFKNMWNSLVDFFANILTAVWDILSGFVEGVIGFFTGLYDTLVGHSIIPDMINGIINWFAQLPGRIIAFIVNLVSSAIAKFNAFKAKVIAVILYLVADVIAKFNDFKARVVAVITYLVAGAVNIFKGIVSKIVTVISGLVSKAKTYFGKFKTAIFNVLKGIDLKQTGINIVKGLINGLKSMLNAVKDIAGKIGEAVTGAVKKVLKLKSPSKVMMSMGIDVTRGLIEGLKENNVINKLKKTTGDLANVVMDTAGKSFSTVSSNNNATVSSVYNTYEVNVSVPVNTLKDINTLEDFLSMLNIESKMRKKRR